MRVRLACGLLALLSATAIARDKKAEKLASKAIKLAKEYKNEWRRFVLERNAYPDADLAKLIEAYEKSVDLFQASLEIEEFGGINGQIVVLARRLAKARFAQVLRKAARNPRPPPKPKPKEPRETPPTKPGEPAPTPKPKPRPAPPPPPEPAPPRASGPEGWPVFAEDKRAARRGKQSLRNFVMNYYFANRKFTALVSRCTRCNGNGKLPSGQLDNRRRIIYVKCARCRESGAHLNINPVRKGYWLVMSPLYRAKADNKVAFNRMREKWHDNPGSIPEFYKRVSLVSVEYNGQWARAKLKEKVSLTGTKRTQTRTVEHIFLRIGKRWFLYDKEADADFFSPDAADDEELLAETED